MGGYATLEFIRANPNRVRRACAIAGYYDDVEVEKLAEDIQHIPLLLVHRYGDRCCPIRSVEALYKARQALSNTWSETTTCPKAAPCEAWFASGKRHGPTDGELVEVLDWLLERK